MAERRRTRSQAKLEQASQEEESSQEEQSLESPPKRKKKNSRSTRKKPKSAKNESSEDESESEAQAEAESQDEVAESSQTPAAAGTRRSYNRYAGMTRGEELLRRIGALGDHANVVTAEDIRRETKEAAAPEVQSSLKDKTVLNAVRKEIASAINNYIGKDTPYAKSFLEWRNRVKGRESIVGKLVGLKGAGFLQNPPPLPGTPATGRRTRGRTRAQQNVSQEEEDEAEEEEEVEGEEERDAEDDDQDDQAGHDQGDEEVSEEVDNNDEDGEDGEGDVEGDEEGDEEEHDGELEDETGHANAEEDDDDADPKDPDNIAEQLNADDYIYDENEVPDGEEEPAESLTSAREPEIEDDEGRWNWLQQPSNDEEEDTALRAQSEQSEEDLVPPSDEELKNMFYGESHSDD